MSSYTWIVPTPPFAGPTSGTSSASGPTGGGAIANGAMSLVIDPITRDLIDSDDGWFVESTDSRTAVLFQLESTYLAWWADPATGSRLRALISGENPGGILEVRDETLRAMQPLVDDGIISEISVTDDVDEVKRPVILLNYRDRSSGQLVDLAYVPFGG